MSAEADQRWDVELRDLRDDTAEQIHFLNHTMEGQGHE